MAESRAYKASRQKIIKALDDATDPAVLGRDDYKELLGDLIGDLEMRLEAAKEEDKE